jgi:hypothetical protein
VFLQQSRGYLVKDISDRDPHGSWGHPPPKKNVQKNMKKSIQHQLFASAHAPDYLSWPLSGYLRRAERDPDLSAHVWPNAKSKTPRTQIWEQISANPHRLWQKIAIFRENLRFFAHWRVGGGAGGFGGVPYSRARPKIWVKLPVSGAILLYSPPRTAPNPIPNSWHSSSANWTVEADKNGKAEKLAQTKRNKAEILTNVVALTGCVARFASMSRLSPFLSVFLKFPALMWGGNTPNP